MMKLQVGEKRGFTLLEVLIVLFLTVIVMGLVFGPVLQTFNFTRRAEVMVRAQDNARLALSLISRDLSNAMYVYGNTDRPIDMPVVDAAGNPVTVQVKYARVDMVLPRMRAYCTSGNHPQGAPRDFDRSAYYYMQGNTVRENDKLSPGEPVCPYDGSKLELRPVQPLAPDTKVVRYFIGLRDPMSQYCNPFVADAPPNVQENTHVLYRVEFDPSDRSLFPGTDPIANLNDPGFFYNTATNINGEPYCVAWKRICRPIVTIPDTDLVKISYQNGLEVTPTVRFSPTPVYNDPMVPTMDTDDDPEFEDAPPTVYRSTYGHWVAPFEIMIEPDKSDPRYGKELTGRVGSVGVRDFQHDYFFRAIPGISSKGAGIDPPTDICVYRVHRDVSGMPHFFVFNISYYERTRDASEYGIGQMKPLQDLGPQRAFTIDTAKGTINFAFPVGDGQRISSNPDLNMLISKTASTDDINARRYRDLFLNEPADQILNFSTVVPRSVKIVAPCCTPGKVGTPMLYTRLPFILYDPGPNQFTLDPYYDDVLGVGQVRFSAMQTWGGFAGQPLPPGKDNIFAYYEVQNNAKQDSIKANYVTKALITVLMGIQIYDSSSGKPQITELSNKVRVKNVH